MARRVGVGLQVAGGEALVGGVEDGQQAAGLDHGENLIPLRLARVDAGRVVRAAVQQYHGALLHSVEVLQEGGDIQGAGGSLVVRIALDLVRTEARFAEDRGVVGPGDVREVDRLAHELGTELGGEAEGSGAGNGLATGDLRAAQLVLPEDKGGGPLGEINDAGDGGVLFVDLAALKGLAVCSSSLRSRARTR